jgi:hypothetical protein
MMFSVVAANGEKNARLLFHLSKKHGAIDLGSISGFFEVDENWHCPVCHRNKSEIARVDKNAKLLCALVRHHDHLTDITDGRIPDTRGMEWQDQMPVLSLRDSFQRFPEILICQDCNVAEGDAKKKVGAPKDFSFGPFEISTFIIVEPNRGHLIDIAKLEETYEKIKSSLGIYSNTIRGIVKHQADPDNWEQAGGAAWRVLQDLNRKRKMRDNG